MPSKSRKLKSKKLKTRKYNRKNEKYMRKRKNASNKKGGSRFYNLFGKSKKKNSPLPINRTSIENEMKKAHANALGFQYKKTNTRPPEENSIKRAHENAYAKQQQQEQIYNNSNQKQ